MQGTGRASLNDSAPNMKELEGYQVKIAGLLFQGSLRKKYNWIFGDWLLVVLLRLIVSSH
jgi:hypothetical protein